MAIVVIRSRVEKARARALLMLQGQDATISVSRPTVYQSASTADSALYPPLVEKFYEVEEPRERGRSRCPCSAHARLDWTQCVDEDAAVGLVEGVDVVPEMEFSRSNVHDRYAV